MHRLSLFIIQHSSRFYIFIPFDRWETEVQRGKVTCLKISASKRRVWIRIYTVLPVPQWVVTTYKRLFGTHGNPLSSVMIAPQNDLAVGGNEYPGGAKKWTCHVKLMCYLTGGLSVMVRGIHVSGQNLPSSSTLKIFCKPCYQERKKESKAKLDCFKKC